MKKKLLNCLGVAALATLLAGCEKKTDVPNENPSDKKDDVVVVDKTIDKVIVGTTAKIETALQGEYNYDMLASGVSEMPLVSQDSNGKFNPLLASYSSADSKTWTYTILDGMKWSDGVSVTAEDILYTLQYEDSNGSANLVDQTVNGKTTKKKYASYSLSSDKKSISLELSTANVRELTNMTSFRVVPKHLYNDGDVSNSDKLVTCGPYVQTKYDKTSNSITFEKNKYYPNKTNVDKVIYQMYSTEDTMYLGLINKEIDFVWNYSSGVASSYQSTLASSKNVTLRSIASSNAPAVLTFNNNKGIFKEKAVREAVSYALDYQTFKKTFGSEYATVSERGFVPSSTIGYKSTESNKLDLAKADEILTKAGYSKVNGVYSKNGVELAFVLTVNSAKAAHVRYAELVKKNLDEFGIKVTIETLDSTAYNAKTSNKFSNNNITMDAAIYGYTTAGMSMVDGLGTIYVNGKHAVQGGAQVYDEVFQSALTKLNGSKTYEEYLDNASSIVDYYATETPLIALYWDSLIYAHSSSVANLVIDNVFGLNNVNTWLNIEKI